MDPVGRAVPDKRWRREVKLLVHPDIRAEIIDWLSALLPPDPVAPAGYRVRSLYYDSDDLVAYRLKKDGVRRRFKLRLRAYGDEAGGTLQTDDRGFLEVKWKLGDLVWKERVEGGLSDLDRLTREGYVDSGLESLPMLLAGHDFAPKSIVEYQRQAFQDEAYRVTMDGPVYGQAAPRLSTFLENRKAGKSLITRRYSVLEFKFQRSLPIWQRDLVRRWNLPVATFSKYGESINMILRSRPYHLALMPIKPVNDDVLAGLQWRD
ncbi:MAG: polyphosphate polymerase domain-containing protein [Pseudomonadota bacterium]